MKAEGLIPAMSCDGCGKCCGPVGMSGLELMAIRKYVREHAIRPVVHSDGVTCPFHERGKGCRIYPVRPFICRLFGHVPTMTCANGHDVPLRSGDQRVVDEAYAAELSLFGAHYMHDVDFSAEVRTP